MNSVQDYVRLLSDRVRVESFRAAIERTVRPGDVVADVGAGTGLLAFYAARAGAARCYALERRAFAAAAAERFLTANGVADRVTVLIGNAEDLAVPEPVDVVVCEMIGQVGFDEAIHEVLQAFCARHLRPGGRIIPVRLRSFLVPMRWQSVPPDIWINDFLAPDFVLPEDFHPFPNPPMSLVPAPALELGPRVVLEDIAPGDPGIERPDSVAFRLSITTAGRVDALVGGFEATLTPDTALSSLPPHPGTSWHLWRAVPDSFSEVQVGDQITGVLESLRTPDWLAWQVRDILRHRASDGSAEP